MERSGSSQICQTVTTAAADSREACCWTGTALGNDWLSKVTPSHKAEHPSIDDSIFDTCPSCAQGSAGDNPSSHRSKVGSLCAQGATERDKQQFGQLRASDSPHVAWFFLVFSHTLGEVWRTHTDKINKPKPHVPGDQTHNLLGVKYNM